MPRLEWDTAGERFYETGVDRGVIYPEDSIGIPWNGLISVTEKAPTNEGTALYFDGAKYGDDMAPGLFSGTVKAFTYPDIIAELEGSANAGNGLFVTNQSPQRFGMTYRTKIGNDVDASLGYKIHVLYNLTAIPSPRTYQSDKGDSALEFEWSLTAIPGEIPNFRPTAHLIFDTRFMGSLLLDDLESTLYGSAGSEARLPPISTLVNYIGGWVIIRITDNLDGTWTATGPDELITMLDATTFQIIQANSTFTDANTYIISDTTY